MTTAQPQPTQTEAQPAQRAAGARPRSSSAEDTLLSRGSNYGAHGASGLVIGTHLYGDTCDTLGSLLPALAPSECVTSIAV